MNSACIIADCATNSRSHNESMRHPKVYFTRDWESYYMVHFSMYIHFRPISTAILCDVSPLTTFSDEKHMCKFNARVKPIRIDAQSIAQQHTFSVPGIKCKDGIDNYIKNNLDKFTTSSIWDSAKSELIRKYLTEIERKYNLIVDESALDYTTQFIWKVEMECLPENIGHKF